MKSEPVRFTPLSPDALVHELATWIDRRSEVHRVHDAGGKSGWVFGFDGAAEIGTHTLTDEVAEALRARGRPVIRATTDRWWRASALRLELGRQDVDMLLTGWVDDAALRRELIAPVLAGGRPYITELRNPETDRSVRQVAVDAPAGAVLLVDGPFLLAADLPMDGMVLVQVGAGALRRAMGDEKAWWVTAFGRYEQDYRPADKADVLVAYDHPTAPAASGLEAGRG